MQTPIVSIHRNKKRTKSIEVIKKLCWVALLPVILAITCNQGNTAHASQVKRGYGDTTKPIAPKQYSVSLPLQSWILVDSIFRTANYWVGREMSVANAEPLKQNFQSIINLFVSQIQEQQKADTIKPKK